MKAIFVDTNYVNNNGSIKIHELIVKNMELQPGEKVVAYQEDDCWDAEVAQEDDDWSVTLLSEAKKVSKERQEGHNEGYWEGIYVQSLLILRVLHNLNYSTEEIEKIKECLGLK
ncbi:MAG: hypothetical protein IJ274_00615 [Lachnospiraceae bacterium]|nr:hypothetical protein [Lachnospiraceae bacterium]